MPTPSTSSYRPKQDRIKDTILKESSHGWGSPTTQPSKPTTPLRIAKRETLSPSTSSSSPSSTAANAPGLGLPTGATRVVARRSSNSYKHMFNNNLVSRSPFRSQLAPRQPLGAANTPRTLVTPRKASGEKRPRPDSLIQQQEQETERRAKELGFKRRQSKGFRTLQELEHVSKSPFKKDTIPENHEGYNPEEPIAIAFPTKHDDETSPETTETESSLNSKERPLTPPNLPVERPYSESPTYVERRSPGPSALQGSPARSSLVQKQRLLGPRSRSLSIGAPNSPPENPPVRQRRKTVTFDERCDVVEFDRESHEDVVFDTDDDDDGFYRATKNDNIDSSQDSYDSLADETVHIPQKHSYSNDDLFDAAVLNDSINGLVDSMLQEASSLSGSSTPEGHSFGGMMGDEDMTTGGMEDGIPLGRSHHSDRLRMHQETFREEETIPPLFDELANERNATNSPPRRADASFEEPHTPQTRHRRSNTSLSQPAVPTLAPDTECVEDGIPLGRSHHSERLKQAHGDSDRDEDVAMLPPSPSPIKTTPQPSHNRDLMSAMIPKLDLGIDFGDSPHSRKDVPVNDGNVFGDSEVYAKEYDEDELDEVLSNTSIASFHEYPPQEGYEEYAEEAEGDRSYRSGDISFGGHSNRSIDALVSDMQWGEEKEAPGQKAALRDGQELEKNQDSEQKQEECQPPIDDKAMEVNYEADNEDARHSYEKPLLSPTTPLSPMKMDDFQGEEDQTGIYDNVHRTHTLGDLHLNDAEEEEPIPNDNESVASIKPEAIVSPKPRSILMTETTVNHLDEVLMLPPTPTEVDHVPSRPSLEERLKRVVSPALSAPSPLRRGSASVSPTPGYRMPSRSPLAISTPPQSSPNMRSHTYESDERPLPEHCRSPEFNHSSPKLHGHVQVPLSPRSANFSRSSVDIAEMDMRSALDRLVDDVSIAGGVEPTQADHARDMLRDQSLTSTMEGEGSMGEMTADGHALLSSLHELDGGREAFSTSPLPGKREESGESLTHTNSMPMMPGPSMQRQSSSNSESTENAEESDAEEPAVNHKHRKHISAPEPELEFRSRPPPVPPKTPEKGKPIKSARQEREEMIREKRREARARESGEYFVPPRRDAAGNLMEESPASRRKSGSRPMSRKSMSMNDVNETLNVPEAPEARRRISELRKQRGGILGMTAVQDEDFTDSIERELKRQNKDGKKKSYEVVEHNAVYASSSQEESIVQIHQNLETTEKIWKAVRRPSDMNEYARQIRELQAKPGKAAGRVFVKVVRIRSLNLPLPQETTVFTCTLNNGTHFVTTPECRLTRDAGIEQEFELIESSKLEFTLSLKVRRDPHIVQQFKSITAPPPLPPPAIPTPSTRGIFSLFGTPKKSKVNKHEKLPRTPITAIHHPVENLARYMKPDGTLARAFIAFKEIAPYCNGCLFETVFPLIGQRLEAPGEGGGAGGTLVPKQVGELVLQVFRLPPIPGVPLDKLPQSSDQCHWGLLNASWHKKTYHEGILTQLGGDCSTWRRRQLRIVGGNLVAFNDVTKRAISTIDLKKAIAVEDDQDPTVVARRRDIDDFDALYGVERSFRILFPDNQEVSFFADTDAEKAAWLYILRQLIGHIPENALWAEMLWQKLSESARSAIASAPTSSPTKPSSSAPRRR